VARFEKSLTRALGEGKLPRLSLIEKANFESTLLPKFYVYVIIKLDLTLSYVANFANVANSQKDLQKKLKATKSLQANNSFGI
jgi:hypothetical protein